MNCKVKSVSANTFYQMSRLRLSSILPDEYKMTDVLLAFLFSIQIMFQLILITSNFHAFQSMRMNAIRLITRSRQIVKCSSYSFINNSHLMCAEKTIYLKSYTKKPCKITAIQTTLELMGTHHEASWDIYTTRQL